MGFKLGWHLWSDYHFKHVALPALLQAVWLMPWMALGGYLAVLLFVTTMYLAFKEAAVLVVDAAPVCEPTYAKVLRQF